MAADVPRGKPVPTPAHMDAETARRAWMARALILVLGGPAAAFVPVFLAIGLPSIAGMMLLCLLPGLTLLVVLRDQRRVFFVGAAITTIVTVGILIGSWLTGGINSPALIWITASPTLAVLLVGRRRAGVVTLGCLLTFVVFWTLDHYGFAAPAPFTPSGRKMHLMVSGVISVAAVFTLAVIFETARISAFRALARARDAAESASRAKADFLAIMSHEIRTPITGVLGALELLDAGDEAADRDDLLRIARRSAESLLAIINDILDFSKIEAGKLTLEAAPFALADLLRDVTAALTPTAAAKGITVSASIDRTLPPAVVGDAVRLRQVLINLLGNAVKFTERGRVTLHARAHTEPGGRIRLEIEVVDTGIGIPADRLDAIFESFSQVDGSTTRRYGGTGLGLTIVKRLVTLMGGTVHVASELGVGTTFKVSLAFVPAEAAPAAPDRPVSPASAAPLPVRTVRALVAEDNTVNQMIIRRMLERIGVSVEVVASGAAAVAAVARSAPDIVFMDQHMPEMDGLDATRAIRAAEGTKRTPIVALTASVLERDRARCHEAGMDDFLAKPVSVAALQGALERWTTWRAGGAAPSPAADVA